jgi:alpha,alpha-trehalase
MPTAYCRWMKEPLLNRTDNFPALRTLNLRQQIPVDLNAILYKDYELLAELYNWPGQTYDEKKSAKWAAVAKQRKEAVLGMKSVTCPSQSVL